MGAARHWGVSYLSDSGESGVSVTASADNPSTGNKSSADENNNTNNRADPGGVVGEDETIVEPEQNNGQWNRQAACYLVLYLRRC